MADRITAVSHQSGCYGSRWLDSSRLCRTLVGFPIRWDTYAKRIRGKATRRIRFLLLSAGMGLVDLIAKLVFYYPRAGLEPYQEAGVRRRYTGRGY